MTYQQGTGFPDDPLDAPQKFRQFVRATIEAARAEIPAAVITLRQLTLGRLADCGTVLLCEAAETAFQVDAWDEEERMQQETLLN